METRDYFAAQVLPVIFEHMEYNENISSYSLKEVAELSYEMADAMLEQRNKE